MAFCQSESGRGTLWRGVEQAGEGADPGGLGRRLKEQLKCGGPCRPFVLHHLLAVVSGVEPKERYLYCASQSWGAATSPASDTRASHTMTGP